MTYLYRRTLNDRWLMKPEIRIEIRAVVRILTTHVEERVRIWCAKGADGHIYGEKALVDLDDSIRALSELRVQLAHELDIEWPGVLTPPEGEQS